MFVDASGKELPANAIEMRRLKDGKVSFAIWWNKVPATPYPAWKINEVLDGLDESLEYKETKTGCYTISRIHLLVDGYFIRERKGEENSIEVCGIQTIDDYDCRIFRYVVTKATEVPEEDEDVYSLWLMVKEKINELCGQSLSSIFGGLPQEYHKYRTIVPKPIDWVNPTFQGKIVNNCVKADICSAYGTEASGVLPDLHAASRQVVNGKVAPSEEWPFAFYLESGEMAIWGEGSSEDLKKTRYMREPVRFVDEERTLLCKAAKVSLRPVFEYLYEHRKENQSFKLAMNATIGMFHRKRFTGEQDNLWPLAAVIKFRCDKRIIDLCDKLIEMGQVPMLINTDSITWCGNDTSLTVTEKKLGNFRIEYENCSLLYLGPKKYQIKSIPYGETDETTLTRWSGPHRKSTTEKLAFGDIKDKTIVAKIEQQEKRNVYRWDKKSRRYIDKTGKIFVYMEDLEL